MNLKSDIIHMSTKWALSFLAAKAKEKKKKKQIQKAYNHKKTEAEIGIMQPPTKNHFVKGKEGWFIG